MASDRRVTDSVATSLDGLVARRDGAVARLSTEGDFGFETFLETVDTVLMGRYTYEYVLAPFGLAPSPTMDIVCEEFDMVFGPADPMSGLTDDETPPRER